MTRQGDCEEDYLYKIEKGIPLPERQYLGTPGEHPRLLYPFPFMEVGDSFFVPVGELSQDRRGALILVSARAFCRRRLGKEMHFVIRRDNENDGIRCWREK